MGGYGSGRCYGNPVVEDALRVEIGWMVRTRRALPGSRVAGVLSWTRGGEPSGSISYTCDMCDPEQSFLELRFSVTRHATGETSDYTQRIWLSYTEPNFGGKRWWMHCPKTGERVGKLYCPAGGETFASRKAYRIGYRSAPLHEILGSLLEIETAHWWRPTAANYFDRVAKARTLEALDAAGGPELVRRYARSKKAELASAAERIFSSNFIGEADAKARAGAWVPEIMRFGSPEEPVEDESADPIGDETENQIAEQAA